MRGVLTLAAAAAAMHAGAGIAPAVAAPTAG
jgi:hypothetical protein